MLSSTFCDVYGQQRILKDRQISRSLVYSCRNFRREMIGIEVPRHIYTHISGIDLVRDTKTEEFLVLEDNVLFGGPAQCNADSQLITRLSRAMRRSE